MIDRCGALAAAALLLGALASTPASAAPSSAGADPSLRYLDQLLVHERAGGGWTFAAPPHQRPWPMTAPLRLAERIGAPLGLADWDVVVLRSPGTPAAALALLDGYRRTGHAAYLDAAARAGDLLLAIQLPSGGWFSEMPVEGVRVAPWFAATVRRTTLDDDVTTGAVRLLLELWQAVGAERYRAAAERGLDLLMHAQLPSGAWPLVWRPEWKRRVWPTFEDLATVNDGTTPAAITTLLAGADALGRDDLRDGARRGGTWLIRRQAPAPQGGWAQQYDDDGRPARARRFEPPALASWESRHAVEALVALADATGDQRYCDPVPRALAWLARSAIRPGCWARFYALDTNAPVYVDADGQLVTSAGDARPGYDWVGDFGIPALFARLGFPLDQGGQGAAARPVRPVAGDPGTCAGERPLGFDRDAPDDPRALVAHAALAAPVSFTPSLCAALDQPRNMKSAAATRQTPAAR